MRALLIKYFDAVVLDRITRYAEGQGKPSEANSPLIFYLSTWLFTLYLIY